MTTVLFLFHANLFLEAFAATVFAAGAGAEGGGQGGILAQMIWPLFNVLLLFSFLALIIYKKGKAHFKMHAAQIEETYHYAQDKDRKAQVQLDNFKKKLDRFDKKSRDVFQKMEEERRGFERAQKRETIKILELMKKDANDRINFERKAMAHNINAFLIGQVVERAKVNIKGEPHQQRKVAVHLVSQMER